MSQSWDPAFNHEGVMAMLSRQLPPAAGGAGGGGGGAAAAASLAPGAGAAALPFGGQHGLYGAQAQAALQQALQASGLLGPLVGARALFRVRLSAPKRLAGAPLSHLVLNGGSGRAAWHPGKGSCARQPSPGACSPS
jgi:hypothetical protein